MRRSQVVLSFALAAALIGCAPRSASLPAGGPSAAATATPLPAWVAHSADRLKADMAAYDAAAATATALADPNDTLAFVPLPAEFARLSSNGGAWWFSSPNGDARYLAFDTGTSDYPIPDGLIYSSSPTAPPEPGSALTTPTPIAPHWWVAAWDPLYWGQWTGSSGRGADAETEIVTRSDRLASSLDTVSGRVVARLDWASVGAMVVWVDTGGPKPESVVLNAGTRAQWPSAWGKVVPDPQAGAAQFSLPARTPENISIVADVRVTTLPSGRTQAFAAAARFSEQ